MGIITYAILISRIFISYYNLSNLILTSGCKRIKIQIMIYKTYEEGDLYGYDSIFSKTW